MYLSNIFYASLGSGGGTGLSGNSNNYDSNGQYNLQQVYDENKNNTDDFYSSYGNKAGTYLRSSINNHYWYGGLTTLNYQSSERTSFSGGIDMRYYKGEHYREVYDLLGADYALDAANGVQGSEVKRVGDKVGYYNDGLVKWAGVFSQAEYSNGILSAFINISGANSSYKHIDYFKKKDLVLADTTYKKR